jgi:hypothetical protein
LGQPAFDQTVAHIWYGKPLAASLNSNRTYKTCWFAVPRVTAGDCQLVQFKALQAQLLGKQEQPNAAAVAGAATTNSNSSKLPAVHPGNLCNTAHGCSGMAQRCLCCSIIGSSSVRT